MENIKYSEKGGNTYAIVEKGEYKISAKNSKIFFLKKGQMFAEIDNIRIKAVLEGRATRVSDKELIVADIFKSLSNSSLDALDFGLFNTSSAGQKARDAQFHYNERHQI